MLKFVPVDYNELDAPFCSDNSLNGYIGYNLDNNEICGKCIFRLNGYRMEIIFLDVYDNDDETVEGLIRSALNFGGNRNVYMAEYKAEKGIKVAEMLGFEPVNNILEGDIPSLLKGSCCKG